LFQGFTSRAGLEEVLSPTRFGERSMILDIDKIERTAVLGVGDTTRVVILQTLRKIAARPFV